MHFIVNGKGIVREAATLRCQDSVVGVLGRILGHADPEGGPLFHALENEIDSVGALLAHSAQPGQDIILFTDTFFAPLDGSCGYRQRLPPSCGSHWYAERASPCSGLERRSPGERNEPLARAETSRSNSR